MFHASQSEPVFLHTSQDTYATHMHTHTPTRFNEAAEMASPEQSDEKLAFSVVFGRCSTAFATKQIKNSLNGQFKALNGQFNHLTHRGQVKTAQKNLNSLTYSNFLFLQ